MHRSGFTLLELVVALMIFALIGLGAHSLLQSVIAGRATTTAHTQRLAQLQKAMWVIEQDISQMEPMSRIPDHAGDQTARFISRGWRNPLSLPRGDRRIITYSLNGQTLIRMTQPANENGTEPLKQVLLNDVNRFVLTTNPGSVEMQMDAKPYGTIRRVIEVPEP